MKNQVMSYQKCCASCFYWTGSRELKPNSGGTVFFVENFNSVNTVGVCSCGSSMYASKPRPANAVICNCYQKWFALK